MAEIEYKFRPCDCCSPPSWPAPSFEGEYYLYECNDTCGYVSTLKYPVVEPSRQRGSEQCPYTVPANTVNVPPDECQYYKKERIIDDYRMLLSDLGEDGCSGDIYTNYICDRIRTAELNEDGSCTETVLLGPEDGDCGGLLGSDHKVTWEYSQPINDCEYKLDPSFEWPQTANLQGFEAIEYKSRTGNKKEKSTTTYKKIIHQPTATCYLKVWMRALIQDYTIAPRTSESSGPCDGPFNKVGEKYEGAVYTYEWEGSGRPCYQNDSKPHFDTDNLIEGDIDWHFETEDVLIASGKSMEVEIKYSFIKGYEPLWPSERGPNDCKNDGFPKC